MSMVVSVPNTALQPKPIAFLYTQNGRLIFNLYHGSKINIRPLALGRILLVGCPLNLLIINGRF